MVVMSQPCGNGAQPILPPGAERSGPRERPILFSAPMVRAILDGRKMQTRRVVKPQPYIDGRGNVCWPDKRKPGSVHCYGQHMDGSPHWDSLIRWHCPYGVPGDALWVRETFRLAAGLDYLRPSIVGSDLSQQPEVRYVADHGAAIPAGFGKTRPAIHMPRAASRISLRITDVRVERLNAISEADALAEGLPWGDDHHPIAEVHGEAEGRAYCPTCGGWGVHGALGANLGVTEVDCGECDTPQKMYRNLWEHINGPGSWDANPWVWAVSFEVIAPPSAPATTPPAPRKTTAMESHNHSEGEG